MAHFSTIAAGVLKESRIVAGVIIHGAFDVACSGTCCDHGNMVRIRLSFGPEGNSVLVSDMGRRLSNPKEFGGLFPFGFELEPTFYDVFLRVNPKAGSRVS
jgi:hypothetical protein